MKQAFYPALALIISIQFLPGQDKKPLPAQIQRGRDLFQKADNGCATCHSLAGIGTAVGPDLKVLGSAVGPHGLVMAMRMTMTAYVQEVKPSSGAAYPGMPKPAQGDQLEIWDLSQTPPVLRKVSTKEVTMKGNTAWKHPPASVQYASQDLADIVAFVKWASTGSSKQIKIEDVEDAK